MIRWHIWKMWCSHMSKTQHRRTKIPMARKKSLVWRRRLLKQVWCVYGTQIRSYIWSYQFIDLIWQDTGSDSRTRGERGCSRKFYTGRLRPKAPPPILLFTILTKKLFATGFPCIHVQHCTFCLLHSPTKIISGVDRAVITKIRPNLPSVLKTSMCQA